jgi:ribosome-associated translation inhibitor RaiA
MNLPFELRQKDVTLTPAMAETIQARAEKLGRFSGRIQSCTVTVEGPGKHHRQGYNNVRIDLVVPGMELVVEKNSEANLELALKEAFRAIGRRLEDQVRKTRGFVKSHEAP